MCKLVSSQLHSGRPNRTESATPIGKVTVIVLVCGDRNYWDKDAISYHLSKLHKGLDGPIERVIHGAARGADTLAGDWGRDNHVPVSSYPAEWVRYGRGAGPVRNKMMLERGKPNLVVAFHDDIERSKGTAHMLRLAKKAGVSTMLIST